MTGNFEPFKTTSILTALPTTLNGSAKNQKSSGK